MTDDQKAAVTALRRCTFLPGSSEKRFVRSLIQRLDLKPDGPLTGAQAARLKETVHRYRRQHRACPCEECAAVVAAKPLQKIAVGDCPCGAGGTLFGRPGEPREKARCAVCAGILRWPPAPITTPSAASMPVPNRPYPWLMEERPEPNRVRRVCLSCGEACEICGERHGRVTTFPGFAQWYRDHIRCGEQWEGLETQRMETKGMDR